jgi:hypothetical protein
MDGPCSFPGGDKVFLLLTASRPFLWPTQPHAQGVLGVLSPDVKRWGREAYHLPPPSAKFMNGGAIPPFPQISSCHSAFNYFEIEKHQRSMC